MDDLNLTLLARDLAINATSIAVLAFLLYFSRHRRREPVVGYLAFNASLFAVSSALSSSVTLNVGVGFGLFAVLSIVRLRSDESSQSEIGYTMVALVLGLTNGLPGLGGDVKIVFSAFLVGVMFIADHPRLVRHRQYQRLKMLLDVVIVDESRLRDEVSRRLGAEVRQLTVTEIDYVRETMRLDVRVATD